ncbi:MAG: hypothetical protein IKG47_07045 [Oscillospiraceae bacterium]|nr:hypothetical protein [Oscillospiraceae bacterium]
MRKFNAKRAVLILSALFIVLVGMIAVVRSGRTQAVLTESKEQTLEIEMSKLNVAILENGKETSTLLKELEGAKLDPGYPYSEKISVKNTGEFDEYVRVIIRKYWISDGKRVDLSPKYICLVSAGDGWTENKQEATAERSVWYCNNYLAVGKESSLLIDGIYIDGEVFTDIGKSVTFIEDKEKKIITTTFDYDDITFVIEAEAQAIQYNSADKAILSAWGVTNVTASGGTVTVSG